MKHSDCSTHSPRSAWSPRSVTRLRVMPRSRSLAATNAAASIAARGKVAVAVWAATAPGGATDIYAAWSADGGRTFGGPVRVNDVAGDASVGGEQPPHVALVPRPGGEPSIVVVWTAKRKEGTRILSARSDDAGASFGRAPAAGGRRGAGEPRMGSDHDRSRGSRRVRVARSSRNGVVVRDVRADAARGPRPRGAARHRAASQSR